MKFKTIITLSVYVITIIYKVTGFTSTSSIKSRHLSKPKFVTPSLSLYRPKTKHRSFSHQLFGFTNTGKPASSSEEDLKLTLKVIQEHISKYSSTNTEENINKSDGTNAHKLSTTSKSRDENILDITLSKLTSAFPLFVLTAAVIGLVKPVTLTWVNRGQLIPLMLASVMMAMGMTLQTEDFTRVFTSKTDLNYSSEKQASSSSAIPAGVLCQYIIMPLSSYVIGSTLLLPIHPAAFLGLILVGCAPGGTASNLVSLIASADVALSVILTSISTLLASVLTPLLVRILAGSAVSVSGWVLFKATASVVLLPVVLGMWIREKIPRFAQIVSRFAPFLGVVLVSLLCGGVVAQNASSLFALSGPSTISVSKLLPTIICSVLLLHSVGFLAGYLVSRYFFRTSEKVARTISIETGMQNSALAVVLARSVMGAAAAGSAAKGNFALSMACLPGALSATAHSCLGSALAVYWRWLDGRNQKVTS